MNEYEDRQFFTGEWLAYEAAPRNYRWRWCVEGVQTGAWSGGVSFLTDLESVEHIIAEQPEMEGPSQWFQWHGDTLIYVYDDGGDELHVVEVEPSAGGEYEMSFGWTWYSMEPEKCDLVIESTMNWQNIVHMVQLRNGVDPFIHDPKGWLDRQNIDRSTTSDWTLQEAARRLQIEREEQEAQVKHRRQLEDTVKTNSNVLENARCPGCGQSKRFRILVNAWATVLDDGIEDVDEQDWDDTSKALCEDCGFTGAWGMFRNFPTWTAGQMRTWLEQVPPETPLLGYLGGSVENYLNVDGLHFDPSNPDIAVTIELRDDYDTQQW